MPKEEILEYMGKAGAWVCVPAVRIAEPVGGLTFMNQAAARGVLFHPSITGAGRALRPAADYPISTTLTMITISINKLLQFTHCLIHLERTRLLCRSILVLLQRLGGGLLALCSFHHLGPGVTPTYCCSDAESTDVQNGVSVGLVH